MKSSRYISIILSLFLLVTIGCTDQNETKDTDKNNASFIVKINSGMIKARAVKVPEHENISIQLHLYLYKKGVSDNVAPAFYQIGVLNNEEETTMYCTPDQNFDLAAKYDAYVVACDVNETIAADASKASLLSMIQEGIVDINSGSKQYMLAGRTLDVELITRTTEVKITRNVCRLELDIIDDNTILFTNITASLTAPDKTFCWNSTIRGNVNTLPSGTTNIEQSFALTKENNKWKNTPLYFFENKTTIAGISADTDKVKLVITATKDDGTNKKYLVYLNKEEGYITQRNTIYRLTGSLQSGELVVTTETLPWEEEVSGDASITGPSQVAPEANSYLLSPEDMVYIPVSQANNSSVGMLIGDDDLLTPEVVWTDVKGAISGKGLADDASVASISVIGVGRNAILRVISGSESGNSVVAVRGEDGTIKWSWHIWVTDYDPEQENGQNTSGGYIFMDRNLGAKSITPNFEGIDVVGNYYQYGRKDPFPTKSTGWTQVQAYNAAGENITRAIGNATSLANMIQQPFMWANATGYPTDMELWGENGDKTTNDPCPAGWRVPRRDAWIDLTDITFSRIGAGNVGREGKHTGFYPNSWHILPEGGFYNRKYVHNWSSTPSGTANAFYLRAGSELNDPTTVQVNYAYSRASGWAVRCVRDWTEGKAEKEVRVLTVGFVSPCAAHQLGIAPLYGRYYVDGLNALLTRNFGRGEPVDAFFKHYNYYNGGVHKEEIDYNIMEILSTYDIDVLYLPFNGWGGTPSVAQAKDIAKWVDADPKRVLIVNVDRQDINLHMKNELGFMQYYAGQTGEQSQLTADNSDIYKTLVMNGKYGAITNPLFNNVVDVGYLMKDEVLSNGFKPILSFARYPDRISMAVHPTRRIILLGDTDWFNWDNGLGREGLLTYQARGQYSLLFANMWAWIVETVKN